MRARQSQSGFALLLFIIVLLATGGFATNLYLKSIIKEIEKSRYKKNLQVLNEAKSALLRYSYNYPQLGNNGPGRLPCADTDNDGQSNTLFGQCTSIGRFPWDEPFLQTPELRDADGERLWYAVSTSFSTQTGGTLNSDTTGTITIKDQSGQVIYDGSADGVAAVIIAPGAPINRAGIQQDRTVSNFDNPDDKIADTDPGIVKPEQYLDLVGTQDNATLTHNSAVDGFMLGPVEDTNNVIVMNDQMVVITSDEIIEMAEKAVLQTYRNAIFDYLNKIWGSSVPEYRYPWLDEYTTTDLSRYDADVGATTGRIPSIFSSYFDSAITQDSETINTDIRIRINTAIEGFNLTTEETITTNAGIYFSSPSGDLMIAPSSDGVTMERYFWDELAAPNGWEPCEPTGTVSGCNQAAAAPGTPDSSVVPNEVAIRVVKVSFINNFFSGVTFSRSYLDNSGLPLVYQAPDSADSAFVFSQYNETTAGDAIDISYSYDDHYLNTFNTVSNGDLTTYSIGVNYYPVLPAWALSDDWHNSVMMAYSQAYQPGVPSPSNCVLNDDDNTDDPAECLLVKNPGGANNNSAQALLVIAGEHDLVDDDSDGYDDELGDIFEGENYLAPFTVFDKREPVATGNFADQILVIQ